MFLAHTKASTYLVELAKLISNKGVPAHEDTIQVALYPYGTGNDTCNQGTFEIDFNDHAPAGLKGQQITVFSLVPMIGCPPVAVSTGVKVSEKFRKLGIGHLMNEMRLDIAKQWGYSLVLCTDREDNVAQQAVLKKNGWKKLDGFVNPVNKKTVALHSVVPKKGKYELGFKLP